MRKHIGVVVACGWFASCGGIVETDSTANNSAWYPNECSTEADCPGSFCSAVTPGGFKVCAAVLAEAKTCSGGSDQCCASSDCPAGEACFATPLGPSCVSFIFQPSNVCAKDACARDEDCEADQICARAGTLGRKVSACVSVGCRVDADCTARAGGRCAPAQTMCCPVASTLRCAYPGDCLSSSDCAHGESCESFGESARCIAGPPRCPL